MFAIIGPPIIFLMFLEVQSGKVTFGSFAVPLAIMILACWVGSFIAYCFESEPQNLQVGRVPHSRWRTWPGIVIALPVSLMMIGIGFVLLLPVFIIQTIRKER